MVCYFSSNENDSSLSAPFSYETRRVFKTLNVAMPESLSFAIAGVLNISKKWENIKLK